MHELPLMAFTLLLQASVGMTLWLAFLHRHILITSSARPVMRPPLLLAFLAGAVGLLISTLHLGYPLNAMHALSHFSSSWLSREIIFGALYLALLGLSTLLVMLRKGGWQLLLMLAAVVGIVDVFCMAQVYIHTSIITWQHYNTLIMFLGTVGILGSALVAVFRISGILPQIDALRNGCVLVIALLVLLRLLVQPLWIGDLTANAMQIATLPHAPLAMLGQLKPILTLSWGISVIGMMFFAVGGCKKNIPAVLFGSVMLVGSEVMLRFVFFSIG
ncbi:dimethyl sulfoxide reductase anchor subunit family protein [Escherichia coli]|uniref:dimethyl sulfoxide reductase anchor subunit family protein n=1 Tax=Escherichia coli TaxID=562 RepID=UPI001AE55784|nr:dimethyl sulfoxide reductase anchor subunit family protein [Escherichia coli]MBP0720388.1 dimethyl sulfoxide reductase anchor subunit family protein [Escherichia coli]